MAEHSPQPSGLSAPVHEAAPPGLPIGPRHPWLAPLAGYSDLPFRLLCRELGASVACTEMVSAKGLVFGQGKKSNATNDLLATFPPLEPPVRYKAECAPCPGPNASLGEVAHDTPLVVQLFGAERAFMADAVRILRDLGYEWFDCNMGCSVPKVRKSGAGSAMMDDLDNALDVAEGLIGAAGTGKVGFKLRLGRSAGEEVYLALGKRLEAAGAGWLTLHPRYANQKFTGRADWEALAPLVSSVSIPVMVSGDLFSAADGVAALQTSGAAGVMFARGAMQNPAVFGQFIALREQAANGTMEKGTADSGGFVGARDLEWVIRRHAALIRAFYPVRRNRQGIETALLKMRTFVPRYVKELSGARKLRRAMALCLTWEAMYDLLDEFFTCEDNLLPVTAEEDI